MKEQILARRTVLRAGLAVGCSLLIPIKLLANDAKVVTDSPESTSPVRKVAQADVQYQPRPKGEQKCASCMNFIAESNACKVVDGTVSPDGWCSLWVKNV